MSVFEKNKEVKSKGAPCMYILLGHNLCHFMLSICYTNAEIASTVLYPCYDLPRFANPRNLGMNKKF